MQRKIIAPNDQATNNKPTTLHKDILRLALSFRDRDKEIDHLLKKLSTSPTQNKAETIDPILSDIIAAIIEYTGKTRSSEGLTKLALRLDRYDLKLAQVDEILAGNLSSEIAESLATELAKRCNFIDPNVERISKFYQSLPIEASLKREITALKESILKGTERAELISTLGTLNTRLADQLSEFSIDKPADGDVDKCKTQLLDLLNHLDLPENLRAKAGELQKKLENNQDASNLKPLSDELANLIGLMRVNFEEEISRLNEFLEQLFARLKDLDQLVDTSSSIHAASSVSRHDMQQNFAQQVSDINKDMDTDHSVNEIRTLVSARLDKLTTDLNTYVVEEEKRQSDAQLQVEEMSRTVRKLESQTQQLSEDLHKQQLELHKDSLTQVLNRAGYEARLRELRSQFATAGLPFSIALVDIDHFKQINDKFGHLAGDKVLVKLADQLSRSVRNTDTVCRYGGEEFVILLAETKGREAANVIDKLRIIVERCNFHHAGVKVPVTISCGVAEIQPTDDSESVLKRADEAMYKAKHSGRNACIYLD